MADAMLRAARGSAATLVVSLTSGDVSDAGQIGLDAPQYQELTIQPALMRRTRATMFADEASRYELILSASAVQEQVSTLQLASAEALFSMSNSVLFAGGRFEVEAWSYSAEAGGAAIYRLMIRAAEAGSLNS